MYLIGLPSSALPNDDGIKACRKAESACLPAWLPTVMLAIGLFAGSGVSARNSPSAQGMPTVALTGLPAQAQTTHRLILSNGSFPHVKDGTVFGNRERLLPPAARGHYREYTVKTPGLSHRGSRRIVCGGTPPSQPEACFYTDDHYASFRLIAR